ncbi:Fe-only nitrogenase accessory protein AnfO [Methanolinea mesophila]|uniref:Fe-only nitrogenase accessory AnfO family protein n=1 Tax=Methanolinea mesophila TaxID=547055 RepID=UPI001AE13611|nr:Fe-only nitrogenase accessory AnfO family protein [Methanolinea mesophila]MBP1928303.1 Fe-only nitrogenase accessory protein AnfO [Methanolinea mesophila]
MCRAEIAVMTGGDGHTVPLNEPGTVVVFRRSQGTWKTDRSLPFALDEEDGLSGLRRKMADLIAFLGDCRAVVAASASGAAFFELEKARCPVWEISGTALGVLDEVWREIQDEEATLTAPQARGAGIPAPRETSPGKFAISIKEIQGTRPEVSSKQVLRQFVRRGEFTELEILCDHVPPWIEMDAECMGLTLDSERTGPDEVRVRLTRTSS